MEKKFIHLYLLIFFNVTTCIFGLGINHFSRHKRIGGLLGEPKIGNLPLPPDQWFNQLLDHFTPSDLTTWQQRYFTNDTFYKAGGPVFLMIGGEGTASSKWMVAGQWIEYAKQFNALCFQLEHRFYGESHPTSDLSVKNLTYLNSEQALADLAYFIASMNKNHNLPPDTKWVAFGGSYPGSLAAWLRLKYPHLVHAAVSSSGPLLAKIDFKEYFEVVEASLSSYNNYCNDAIKKSNEEIEILLKSTSHSALKKYFKICDDLNSKNDIDNFFESLAGNFAGVVQYNKDNRLTPSKSANITIEIVCDIMVNQSIGTPIDRYAQVNSLLLDAYDQKCLDINYKQMIKNMKEISWNSSVANGARQWTYQTCTEFGFFQTSTQQYPIFGNHFPIDFFIQQCEDIFGPKYNEIFLNSAAKRSNIMYGDLNIDVSRVVFVHGSIDPWHALGILQSKSSFTPAIYIKGTAHCANMYPSSEKDPEELIEARLQIGLLLQEWLQ